MVGVDQFRVAGRHISKNAQPAERVDAFIFGAHSRGDRLATGPVKSVASNDHAAIDALFDSVLHKRHRRPVAFDVVKCNIACIVDDLEAPLLARFHEIARYLGLAVDGDGNVYVSEYGNDRIQVFDPQARFLRKWGSEGNGDGEFSQPQGLAIDSDGDVYVSDQGNHRILVFKPTV